MALKSKTFRVASALAATALCANAVQIRSYLPATHDRFTGFPDSPVINETSFFDGDKVRGIGWRVDETQWQFALVTRSHVLFATHAAPPIGSEIRFLNDTGQIISRQVASNTVVRNVDDDPQTPDTASDLLLVALDSPIAAESGVPPFPYLDLPSDNAYTGREIIAFGRIARAGTGVIDGLTDLSGTSLNPTVAFTFNYDYSSGGADDARLESGDSGSPSIVMSEGEASIVGINSAINAGETSQSNLDVFVPAYVDELDRLLAPSGYRMTPVNGRATSLSATISAVTPTPRKANPLSIGLVLENTGSGSTGNLEVEFEFAPGEEPESISGQDWVSYVGNSSWTLRKASLGRDEATSLTLAWNTAPIVENLAFGIDWRSDKSPDGSVDPSFPLGSSFNEWAAGLASPGLMDDPDHDKVPNLTEYALGSDAESGVNVLPNGESAQPGITSSGTTVAVTFPERSDAASRGLSYVPQWSDSLSAGSWSATFPAGLESSTSPFDPPVPGFVERTLVWPATDLRQFVRLDILLNE